jgi:UDP-2-acetamido-3-amino-2,3-dideoxy-glucuronate N-acetyltransferase
MVFTNVYNPRSAVARKDEYRRTLVRAAPRIGANATIVCGVTIGEPRLRRRRRRRQPRRARLRPDGRRAGAPDRLDQPLRRTPGAAAEATGRAVCPHTGDVYACSGGVCTLFHPMP